jgi:hypothetical protein
MAPEVISNIRLRTFAIAYIEQHAVSSYGMTGSLGKVLNVVIYYLMQKIHNLGVRHILHKVSRITP